MPLVPRPAALDALPLPLGGHLCQRHRHQCDHTGIRCSTWNARTVSLRQSNPAVRVLPHSGSEVPNFTELSLTRVETNSTSPGGWLSRSPLHPNVWAKTVSFSGWFLATTFIVAFLSEDRSLLMKCDQFHVS